MTLGLWVFHHFNWKKSRYKGFLQVIYPVSCNQEARIAEFYPIVVGVTSNIALGAFACWGRGLLCL